MKKIVGMLSKELKYLGHEIQTDGIVISVESKKNASDCRYCGQTSDKVHSYYIRKLQDLPIQGKKVRLHIKRKKYFCVNKECGNMTFAVLKIIV